MSSSPTNKRIPDTTEPSDPSKKIKMSENTKNDTQTTEEQEMFKPVGEAATAVDDMVVDPTAGATGEGIRNTTAADAEGHPVQEIESLCMNCQEQGITRLLLTKIPFFREIVIMSFSCPHCGFRNSEIQPASEIQPKGCRYTLKVEKKEDLNRQVIKSDYCSCKFTELELEIPAKRGQLTTVEGLLNQTVEDLESDQPLRKHMDENLYNQIDTVIKKFRSAINGEILPLTFSIDDPTGNSWIEFVPNEPAHKWSHSQYVRSDAQNEQLGIKAAIENPEVPFAMETSHVSELVPMGTSKAIAQSVGGETERPATESQATKINNDDDIENLNTEVQTFHAICPACHSPTPTHMKVVNIPYFKDVIIMSTVCDQCGYKSNDVKTGGAIPEKGSKVTLKVTDPDDLTRDILKGETAELKIPELNLDLNSGTLGGRFTTLEGILRQVYEELEGKVFSETSDSMDEKTKSNWEKFLEKLNTAIEGKIEFTVEIIDPLAGSYIQNPYAPDADPNMIIEEFERTDEQNEDLGINDMVV